MKKKLEAELISIAHRILKLKNKSDVVALHQETQKLYEILSVLRFVEEKFGDAKPTIGSQEVESKLEEFFDEQPVADDEVPQPAAELAPSEETEVAKEAAADEPAKKDEPEVEDVPKETPEIPEIDPEEINEEISESENEVRDEEENVPQQIESEDETDELPEMPEQPEIAEELEITAASDEVENNDESENSASEKEEFFTPSFELAFDPKSDDAVEVAKDPTPQFSFDDLLGKDYADPVFVKPHENESPAATSSSTSDNNFTPPKEEAKKPTSLNDRLSKGITIGINDRIAFMNHLFANSSEDYNRVLSQLMTFDTFDEAKSFIDEMVKPDYNNWDGKEEYAQRFMEIVEKRFS